MRKRMERFGPGERRCVESCGFTRLYKQCPKLSLNFDFVFFTVQNFNRESDYARRHAEEDLEDVRDRRHSQSDVRGRYNGYYEDEPQYQVRGRGRHTYEHQSAQEWDDGYGNGAEWDYANRVRGRMAADLEEMNG